MNETHPEAPVAAGRRLILRGLVGATVLLAGASLLHLPTSQAGETGEAAVKIAPPAFDAADAAGTQRAVAVFAGGCFWGVQAVFQHTDGVLQAVSGYAGGNQQSAKYPLVSSGMTEHAEAVQVTYDPRKVSYGKLLQIFFSVIHDPTQLNRQGPDTGPQYRSAIFVANPQQKQVAERYIAQLDAARAWPAKIVTSLEPLKGFYAAEAYHQDYATLHPTQPYIARFDRPKIENMRTMFPELFRKDPVLVNAAGALASKS
ncbi:peptide-methionine (S)-S-oxide reductase MsrA [Piscinibacter koreensis]|uniref:Peptide methionine sulfoxide reductase MsrA n=1 Tax=Piscinibacter koreensis TaxID=2742824 RepID=A0A7Y6TW35_9BURK|nr:peptide-methionine (S)-S-oxide reductase MsrA [Schlegelella koreensis]NUZ05719.1 peptide-methionine (S)-S-oxide reductase MsrA [Schlegelella koreensis]